MTGRARTTVRASIAGILSLLLAGAGSSACKTATQPSAPTTSETFSGSLQPQGGLAQSFSIKVTGQVNVTLISLDPLGTINIGVGLGTPSGNSCGVFESSTAMFVGSSFSDVLPAGGYCLAVFDVGSVSQTVTYSVRVDHS